MVTKDVCMTRADAFLFAIKKVIDEQRALIDGHDVRSIQVTVSLGNEGKANVHISHRTEHTVVGCYDGIRRHDRYEF